MFRTSSFWCAVALATTSLNSHAADQTGARQRQQSADDPPPSMALLEFVALFETRDGEWMDLNEIPISLDEQIREPQSEVDGSSAPAPQTGRVTDQKTDQKKTPPSRIPINAH